ncbi:hypothetical protein RJT34_31450 [Clitoria ternatea]|uniref:DUF7610 domain-containing protein n=1 Tax=Clitoria ternatea TaxID=43366 RepID=A0AAN9F256_CLITE
MTKNYKTLQSKLQELESILDEALLQDPDTVSHDIKQKFAFVRKLLSAEVASHPSKPHHLHQISEWLAKMEKGFHQWDASRTFSSHDSAKQSTCSCTESRVNDDGEALDDSELIVFDDPEKLFPGVIGEKAIVEYSGAVADPNGCVYEEQQKGKISDKLGPLVYEDAEDCFEDYAGDKELVEFVGALLGKTEEEGKKDNDLEREKGRGCTFGKKCCALACGFVIGMTVMGFIMVNFSGCFYYVGKESFVLPT